MTSLNAAAAERKPSATINPGSASSDRVTSETPVIVIPPSPATLRPLCCFVHLDHVAVFVCLDESDTVPGHSQAPLETLSPALTIDSRSLRTLKEVLGLAGLFRSGKSAVLHG